MSAVRRAAGGRTAFVVGLALVLVVGFYLLARPSGSDTPLDPRSTSPTGTKALVLLLEEQGAEVDLSDDVPAMGEADVVLLLQDTLEEGQRDDLLRYVEAGGRVVVADERSPLTPLVTGTPDLFGGGVIEPGTCTIDTLASLGDLLVPFASTYEVSSEGDTTSCFGDDESAFVVSTEVGRGVLVGIAGPAGLTNELLGESDNAPFAASLLAPQPGTTVRFLAPPSAGSGLASMGEAQEADELLDPGLVRAMVQLGVAFLFFAVWRAIRLGKPVEEPQPVQVEGSELVAAVGRLLQQNRTPQASADLLRYDLRRTLEDRIGVPADAPAEVAVQMVVERTGFTADAVRPALDPTEVQDDAGLVEVAHSIEVIRAEVLHGRHP